MKKIYGIILIFALMAIVILYFILFNSQNLECVKVQTTCCPCSNGGTEVCVLASEKEKYEVNESNCPDDLICATMYNCNENPCEFKSGECGFYND